ncbi:hypothetical protein FH972_014289 [Carpinus fangiana]|uniref:Late nodulin n=1 Tax=Carpinus fangiana TaxID=176857 RepID=A0A5N6R9I6_9ROSI|nr:hypothetical protein FH972_014289 [Carpinus fangiana]
MEKLVQFAIMVMIVFLLIMFTAVPTTEAYKLEMLHCPCAKIPLCYLKGVNN